MMSWCHVGGVPYSVIGVVDTLQAIKPDVVTVALGACYSYSSLILVSLLAAACKHTEEVQNVQW